LIDLHEVAFTHAFLKELGVLVCDDLVELL